MNPTDVSSLLVGGRHLEAISLNKNLNVYQKAIMHAFASLLDFRGDFSEERYVSVDELSRRTSLGERQVQRELRKLEALRYLHRRVVPGKPAFFRLASRVFEEYMAAGQGCPMDTPTPVQWTPHPCPMDTQAPSSSSMKLHTPPPPSRGGARVDRCRLKKWADADFFRMVGAPLEEQRRYAAMRGLVWPPMRLTRRRD